MHSLAMHTRGQSRGGTGVGCPFFFFQRVSNPWRRVFFHPPTLARTKNKPPTTAETGRGRRGCKRTQDAATHQAAGESPRESPANPKGTIVAPVFTFFVFFSSGSGAETIIGYSATHRAHTHARTHTDTPRRPRVRRQRCSRMSRTVQKRPGYTESSKESR
jgi:hypothetical protein